MKKQLSLFAIAAALLASSAQAADGPVTGTDFTVDFGRAAVSGAGNTLRANHLPLSVGGTTVYFSTVFELGLRADGSLSATLTGATPEAGPAAAPTNSNVNFKAGLYADTATGCTYQVNGPAVNDNGARTYTMAKTSASGTQGCYDSANWSTAKPVQNFYAQGRAQASLGNDGAYGRTQPKQFLSYDTTLVLVQAIGNTISFSFLNENNAPFGNPVGSFVLTAQ